jgi:hypothetical protein
LLLEFHTGNLNSNCPWVSIMNSEGSEKSRLIIVSNRLPFTVRLEEDQIRFDESAGGLVSGLSTFLDSYKYHFIPQEKHVWIGWPAAPFPMNTKTKSDRKLWQNVTPILHSCRMKTWDGFIWARAADPDQSRYVATELMDNIVHFTANINVQDLQGDKAIEVRNDGVNKEAPH